MPYCNCAPKLLLASNMKNIILYHDFQVCSRQSKTCLTGRCYQTLIRQAVKKILKVLNTRYWYRKHLQSNLKAKEAALTGNFNIGHNDSLYLGWLWKIKFFLAKYILNSQELQKFTKMFPESKTFYTCFKSQFFHR